jgi:hypothetical protein
LYGYDFGFLLLLHNFALFATSLDLLQTQNKMNANQPKQKKCASEDCGTKKKKIS